MSETAKHNFGWEVFVVSLAIFALTAPHTIFLDDNAELITAGQTLGIAHPPGYPVYTLLGKLFSLIPFESVAWRLNLFSALCGSLAFSIWTLLVLRPVIFSSTDWISRSNI